MKRHALLFAALAVIVAGTVNLQADEFYDTLLQEVGTNASFAFSSKSPLLLDAHNIGPKLTNWTAQLSVVATNDELLGVKLGMST